MKEFLRRLTQIKRIAVEMFFISFAINLLGLVSSLYSIQVLNRYISQGIDATLLTLTVGALLALALEIVARSSRMRMAQWLCTRSDRNLAKAAFHALSRSLYTSIENIPPESRREALSGLNTIQMSFGPQNLTAILDGPFGLIFVLFLFLLNPTLGFVVSLLLVVLVLTSIFIYSHTEEPTKNLSQSMIAWSSQQGTLSSSPELSRVFPIEKILAKRWHQAVDKVLSLRQVVSGWQSNAMTITYTATAFQTILIYGLGSREVINGNLDVGSLIGASILASRATAQVNRVLQLLEPIKRGERSLDLLSQLAVLPRQQDTGMSLPQWSGQIHLEDLAFAYPGQPVPLMESLELNIPSGTVVIVGGANGAGKTTLARLMMGLLKPSRGRIRIDGMDLRQTTSDWWCRQCMYLPQEPTFFDGTLKDNILLDNDEISEEQLLNLLQEVGLNEFLQNSQDGFMMNISNNAHSLPVGIRRRIALARALAINSQLAIFDDPTEALDSKGCIAIANILNRLVKERKTIIIMSNDPFIIKASNVFINLDVKPVPTIIWSEKDKEVASTT